MKILIIPTVREIYENQFEYCVDIKLIKFIKTIFHKSSIEIFNEYLKQNYDLIILAGGNNSINQNKADKVRNKLNNTIYNFAMRKKIKIIGICHGAHFLSKKIGFILKIKKNNIRNHKVIFKIDKNIFNKNVNSFHNEMIDFKKINNINIFGITEERTIEAFHVKNKQILAIMWHPERYYKIKEFDKELIKGFYATNSIVCR